MQRPATNHSQKINQQIRKQLLSRTDKHKQMISLDLVPQSNKYKIIVPCLQKTFGFKTNQYALNKSNLQQYISRVEFNSFVRSSNKIVEDQVILKTKKENQSFFNIISTLLKIAIVIAVLTFFLLAVIVFSPIQQSNSNIILVIAGILLTSASIIAAVCPIVIYNSKYQAVDYEQTIRNRLENLKQLENDKLLKEGRKHLKWEIQKNFFWIELHINHTLYQKPQNNQEKPQNNEEKIETLIEQQQPQVSANNLMKLQKSTQNIVKSDEMIQDF